MTTNHYTEQPISTSSDYTKIFEEEIEPHLQALYNFAFHLTYNEADADDLVQETSLRAYKGLASYEQGSNAKAWLFKILKNTFLNETVRKKKQPIRVDYQDIINRQEDESVTTTNYPTTIDFDDAVFQDMLGDEVSEAINALPIDYKTIVLLSDIEGFSYEEMSKILDIPIGTVRSRLHRARNLLRKALQQYATTMGFKTSKSD